MVEVIGKSKKLKKKATCQNCGAKLKYYPNEVQTLWSGTDIGGGPDGAEGFNCPNCGKRVITKRW